MARAARSSTSSGRSAGRRPPVTAAIKAVKKGGFVQGRPWRYIAVVISAGGFYHESTKVKRGDYVFWVNMDERAYVLTFPPDSPFENKPITIPVPAKEAGSSGNWGLSDRFRVRQDAQYKKHAYDPTALNWNGPPDPPDIDVGG